MDQLDEFADLARSVTTRQEEADALTEQRDRRLFELHETKRATAKQLAQIAGLTEGRVYQILRRERKARDGEGQ